MSSSVGRRTWRVAAAAMAAIVIAPGATLGAQAATHAVMALIDVVRRTGPEAQLPPHLSMVLGVESSARPTPVRQAIVREGVTVRTFNVRTARRADVVLIVYNEQTRASKAYVISPAGVLRKAVAFQAGGAPVERSLAEARGESASEIEFWADYAKQARGPR